MRPDRKTQHHKKSSQQQHLVCGKNSVKEVLRHKADLIECLFCTSTALDELQKEGVQTRQFETQLRSAKELESMLHTTSHQGLCVALSRSQEISFDELCDENFLNGGTILALDGIQDPHNLGALFRAAECFGVRALLWSRNRTVGLTPSVTKVAVGASELVPFCAVGNLSQALTKLKERGVWVMVAANGVHAKKPQDVNLPGAKCLVMGSEGDGASHVLRELADLEVFVPMQGKIDSMNVSQAGAVLLAGLAS